MYDFFSWLFETTPFQALQESRGWTAELAWLHNGSDLLIWLACVATPLVLLFFLRQRRGLPFPHLFWLAGALILLLGFTHLLVAVSSVAPFYRFVGVAKLITAITAWSLVVVLVPTIPRILEYARMLPGARWPEIPAEPAELSEVRSRQFLIAILSAVLAFLVRLALDPIFGTGDAFVLPLFAVAASAWAGGFWPAITALLIGLLGAVYFAADPRGSLIVPHLDDQIGVGLYVFLGLGLAVLGESQLRARKIAAKHLEDLETNKTELESQIEHRKLAEHALGIQAIRLAAAERRFRELAESLPQLVWTCRSDGYCDYLGPQWERYSGVPIERLAGSGWLDLVHPDDRDSAATAWRAAVESQQIYRAEYRVRRHDGAYRWFIASGVPTLDEEGKVEKWFGTSTDIHDRREAEAERARLAAIIDGTPDFVKMADPRGRVLTVNPAGRRMLGIGLDDDVTSRSIADLHPPDIARRLLEEAFPTAARVGSWTAETRFRAADGREIPVSQVVIAHRDPTGAVEYFSTIARDISLVKEAEARFRHLAESIPNVVWTATPNGDINYYNRRWYEYTGLSPDESRGQGWQQVIHPDDQADRAPRWLDSLKRGATHEVEQRLRRADGQYRWHLVRGQAVRDDSGRIVQWVGTLTDIEDQRKYRENLEEQVRVRTTELVQVIAELEDEVKIRRQAEERAEAISVELRRSNEELEQFAYVASHDLQEPLRKIQAFSDRLQSQCASALSGPGLEYLERIVSAAGRMRALIDGLLTYARVTTRARPFVPVNLDEVAAGVVDDLAALVHRTGGAVEIGELPAIEADPLQMRLLLQNLIANGLKFHREGVPPRIVVNAELEPSPTDGSTACRLTVADNGIGFESKYAERIFQMFQRLHGRSQYDGTGIGLAICKKIVDRHGGAIVPHSRPGEGTTFEVTLPVRAALAQHPESAGGDHPSVTSRHSSNGPTA
jgi:PAS domain S-box-containing protein